MKENSGTDEEGAGGREGKEEKLVGKKNKRKRQKKRVEQRKR